MRILRPSYNYSWSAMVQRTSKATRYFTLKSAPNENVQRVRQLFQENRDRTDLWEQLWREGRTPWDLGGPTQVLISELQRQQQQPQCLAKENNQWFPQRALIPGCGSGYDIVSLARYWDQEGKDTNTHRTVYGVELSETSLGRAEGVLLESIRRHGELSRTNIQLYHGDFFACPSTWQLFYEQNRAKNDVSITKTTASSTTANNRCYTTTSTTISFDFIFDYTFFCAIPPTKRRDWGRQMTRLITKESSHNHSGKLLTLMFPYVTTPRPDCAGPPYLVSHQDYVDALQAENESDVQYPHLQLTSPAPYPNRDTVSSRIGQEMVGWWSFRI
jgi:methyl halide transferase